jgi:hypothetical protein
MVNLDILLPPPIHFERANAARRGGRCRSKSRFATAALRRPLCDGINAVANAVNWSEPTKNTTEYAKDRV